jgi:hypothetical protein
MRSSTLNPRLSRFIRFIARVLPLAIAAAAPPASGAQTFQFQWPIPVRVGVTCVSDRDSVTTVMHFVAHLYQTLPNELKLQWEAPEILDFRINGYSATGIQSQLAQLTSLAAQSLPMTISRSGEFLRAPVGEETQRKLIEWLRGMAGSAISPEAWASVERMMRSPQTAARMEGAAAESWNAWVGAWVGLELDPGRQVEGRIPLVLADESVEGSVHVENQGPTPGNPRLTRLVLQTVMEGDKAREALERFARSMVRDATGREPPVDRLFRSVTRTEQITAVVDPNTLRPSYAENLTLTDTEDMQGSRRRQSQRVAYFFEWTPPLLSTGPPSPVPKEALDLYYSGRLEEAKSRLETEVQEGATNPDTHAYFAETCRRLRQPGLAVLDARRALMLSPRHSFAYQVLGDAYAPQFGPWLKASFDSTWENLLRAVACDSTDGNPWMGLTLEAMHRHRSDIERQGLRALVRTGFLTPKVLGYGRWMLRDLPDSTILITNGDMDSYPLWALQEVERLRPDVAVVNYPLLNLPWYARRTRDLHGVPLPFTDVALDSLRPELLNDTTVVYVSGKILRGWVEMKRSERLLRPFVVAVTVPAEALPPGVDSTLMLIGPGRIYRPGLGHLDADTVALRRSMDGVAAAEFRGLQTSERDRSPVRQGAPPLTANIVEGWMVYANALLEAGRSRDTAATLRRAEAFARAADVGDSALEAVVKLKESADKAAGRKR